MDKNGYDLFWRGISPNLLGSHVADYLVTPVIISPPCDTSTRLTEIVWLLALHKIIVLVVTMVISLWSVDWYSFAVNMRVRACVCVCVRTSMWESLSAHHGIILVVLVYVTANFERYQYTVLYNTIIKLRPHSRAFLMLTVTQPLYSLTSFM